MSKTITAHVSHQLGKVEAKRRIQQGFGALQPRESGSLLGVLSFEKQWAGDRLQFEATGLGQRIAATLDVLDDSVQIRMEVPDLLAAFAEMIQEQVKKETVKSLEHTK